MALSVSGEEATGGDEGDDEGGHDWSETRRAGSFPSETFAAGVYESTAAGSEATLFGNLRIGVGAYKPPGSCPRMIASPFLARSSEPALHPVTEMRASAQQKIEDLRVTPHLQTEEWNAIWSGVF